MPAAFRATTRFMPQSTPPIPPSPPLPPPAQAPPFPVHASARDPWDYTTAELVELLVPVAGNEIKLALEKYTVNGETMLFMSMDILRRDLEIKNVKSCFEIMKVVRNLRIRSKKLRLYTQNEAAGIMLPDAGEEETEFLIRRMELPEVASENGAERRRKRKRLLNDDDGRAETDEMAVTTPLSRNLLNHKARNPITLSPWAASSNAESVQVDLKTLVDTRTPSPRPASQPEIVIVADDGEEEQEPGPRRIVPTLVDCSAPPTNNEDADHSITDEAPPPGDENQARRRVSPTLVMPLKEHSPSPTDDGSQDMDLDTSAVATPSQQLEREATTPILTAPGEDVHSSMTQTDPETGKKRLAPTLIGPVFVPPPSPPPAEPPSPKPRSSSRYHYLPNRGRKIDTFFYDVEVGKVIPDPATEQDAFCIFNHGDRYTPGERKVVSRHMRRFLMRWTDENHGLHLTKDGHVRRAVKYYNGDRYLRKHEHPSFTVLDVRNGVVEARRQTTETLSLPWDGPTSGISASQRVQSFMTTEPQKHGPTNYEDEFDILERKWTSLGDDTVLPVYGDSGSENDLPISLWREIEAEQATTLERPLVSKPRRILTPDEIEAAIEAGILAVIARWEEKTLPKLERSAFQEWRRAKRAKMRTQLVKEGTARLEKLNQRLQKQKRELKESGILWTRMSEIERQCRGNLGLTIEDIESVKWEVELMQRKTCPERPPPQQKATKDMPADEMEDLEVEDEVDDCDDTDGSESIGSTTDAGDGSESELEGFVVPDTVDAVNASLPEGMESLQIGEWDPVLDSDSDEDVRPARRTKKRRHAMIDQTADEEVDDTTDHNADNNTENPDNATDDTTDTAMDDVDQPLEEQAKEPSPLPQTPFKRLLAKPPSTLPGRLPGRNSKTVFDLTVSPAAAQPKIKQESSSQQPLIMSIGEKGKITTIDLTLSDGEEEAPPPATAPPKMTTRRSLPFGPNATTPTPSRTGSEPAQPSMTHNAEVALRTRNRHLAILIRNLDDGKGFALIDRFTASSTSTDAYRGMHLHVRRALRVLHQPESSKTIKMFPDEYLRTLWFSMANLYVGWFTSNSHRAGQKVGPGLGHRLESPRAFWEFTNAAYRILSNIYANTVTDSDLFGEEFLELLEGLEAQKAAQSSSAPVNKFFSLNKGSSAVSVQTSRQASRSSSRSSSPVRSDLAPPPSSTAVQLKSTPQESSSAKRKKHRVVQENQEARATREKHIKFEQALRRRLDRLKKQAKSRGETFGIKDGKVVINIGHYEKHKDVLIEEGLGISLKEHQIEGIRFMWKELVQSGVKSGDDAGALLAHTMGLGKTLQVIALIHTLATASASDDPAIYSQLPKHFQGGALKTLILVPPGLIDNWLSEFANWLSTSAGSNSLHIAPIGVVRAVTSGAGGESHNMKQIAAFATSGSGGVLIIGYQMFRRLVKVGVSTTSKYHVTRKHLLEAADLIIADEAHHLKNQSAQLTRAARQFKSRSRIAMTGSPLANNLEEYWNMIDWIHPGFLGPIKEFRAKYVVPIQAGLYLDSEKTEIRQSKKMLAVLHRTIQPKIHRADISVIRAAMPAKTEFMLTVPLTDFQMRFYEAFLANLKDKATDPKEQYSSQTCSRLILNASFLMALITAHPRCFIQAIERKRKEEQRKAEKARLKQTANAQNGDDQDDDSEDPDSPDTPMALDEADSDVVDDAETTALQEEADAAVAELSGDGWIKRFSDEMSSNPAATDLANLSNKFRAVTDIVRLSIRAGDKLLIFSHHLETLGALDEHLAAMKVSFRRIDGATAVGKRQNLVTKFNEDTGNETQVMLISTQAGGLGLNLYGANRVIIFDFKWSPMWEQQAVGRAYRMGQKKPVFVYRLLAGGTFEDTLWNMASFKTNLSQRVVDQKDLMRSAKKNLQQYLLSPKIIGKSPSLDTFKNKDKQILDVLLNDEESYIYDVKETETFQADNEEDLTEEEKKEVEMIIKAEDEDRKRYQKALDDGVFNPAVSAAAAAALAAAASSSSTMLRIPTSSSELASAAAAAAGATAQPTLTERQIREKAQKEQMLKKRLFEEAQRQSNQAHHERINQQRLAEQERLFQESARNTSARTSNMGMAPPGPVADGGSVNGNGEAGTATGSVSVSGLPQPPPSRESRNMFARVPGAPGKQPRNQFANKLGK